ncbi:hypothetical protein R1sor_025010 [Riccia sorocarpa]|uniref:Uncharacterized protein n=1 Tax=Riccia sorocarpa TaxID=122646 RepID=A0ABD3G7C2_9MARC
MSGAVRNRGMGEKVGKREWSGTWQLLCLALMLATGAWISLVFSAKNQCAPAHSAWNNIPSAWSDTTVDVGEDSGLGEKKKLTENGTKTKGAGSLSMKQIVFGIAGSAQLWPSRQEIIKLWWRPNEMRGFVWLEESVPEVPGANVPPVMVSEDTSRFTYTHALGHPSGIRISRVVSETFRLRLPNVKWFVMGDDDTLFNVDNLVRLLSKYDPSELWYIGSPSESHRQNDHFSSAMAYGGGGFAVSYSLAALISEMQDSCMERYPQLFGSDDRLHACISELGVPLTREPGFHQFDIIGNAFGILAAHPVAPFLSMHHLQLIRPLLPGRTALDSLKHLTKAMKAEPSSFLQQAICYDKKRSLSFSISIGYVVQVFPQIVLPRMLMRPLRTFSAWNRVSEPLEFTFDTRPVPKSICKHPLRFFLDHMEYDREKELAVGLYERQTAIDKRKKSGLCWPSALPPDHVTHIRVVSRALPDHWFHVPRRQCAHLTGIVDKVLGISVEPCQPGELIPA